MSLPLLATLAVPLFLGPWTTHRIYQQVERLETAAIAVDNAGILLGRRGRTVLEQWRQIDVVLKAAESVHHVIHLCARTPGPQAAACAVEDQAWEAVWETRLQILQAQSWFAWKAAAALGKAEGERLGVHLALWFFPECPPVERRTCSICLGRFRIEWLGSPHPRWETQGLQATQRSEVSWLRPGAEGKWNYQLRLPREGDDHVRTQGIGAL